MTKTRIDIDTKEFLSHQPPFSCWGRATDSGAVTRLRSMSYPEVMVFYAK